jgi:glycine oxidase
MSSDAVIIGGGVIGLGIAWRAAERGLSVTVCDPNVGRGASWVAAGMLAPVTEAHYGEEPLLALNLASARRWLSFRDELVAASGVDPAVRTDGTIEVAFDDDDLRALDVLISFRRSLGVAAERLSGRECRALEPLLHPRVRGGVLAADDHQVDNRALVAALIAACHNCGVDIVDRRVAGVAVDGRRVSGVVFDDRQTLAAGSVVLAAGCWSREVAGLSAAVAVPVRPVKGQILRLYADPSEPLIGRSVCGLARTRSVYLVPRANGEIVVGATVEERGFDTVVTAGAVREMLDAAVDLVPGISEAALVESAAGLRPATPDNAPLLGACEVDGLLLATGHYRNGILLTPITADVIAGQLATGALADVAAPFTIARFR